MKTLRDEWKRLVIDPLWTHLFTNSFFREYGSYRVVEGVLCKGADRRIGIRSYGQSHGHDWVAIDPIGTLGDHVKLLLPPEEKKKTPRVELLARLCEAEGDLVETDCKLRCAAARADKYKKALREIAEKVGMEPEGGPARFREGRQTMGAWLGSIAKEALDE
jgi:hypothetical protein